jgi:hypothetical protein
MVVRIDEALQQLEVPGRLRAIAGLELRSDLALLLLVDVTSITLLPVWSHS